MKIRLETLGEIDIDERARIENRWGPSCKILRARGCPYPPVPPSKVERQCGVCTFAKADHQLFTKSLMEMNPAIIRHDTYHDLHRSTRASVAIQDDNGNEIDGDFLELEHFAGDVYFLRRQLSYYRDEEES